MNISPWNNLSIADKAAMMEVAVRNGITDLNEIRQKYNEFAKGGNLYPDGGYTRSTNDHPVAFDSEGNLVDQVTGETGTMRFPEILLTANPDDVARGRAQRWYKDFGTESNDATSFADGRRQNSHLDERSRSIPWDANPVLNTIGLGLGAVPFAVAAYPVAAGAGELAYGLGNWIAATRMGQTVLPYADAGLTSVFAAHGLNHAINEGITDWKDGVMTALEVTPLGRLAKPLWNAGKEITLAAENYRYPLGRPMGETAPQITAENAASITSEQWTAAQDAAIARGDMAEAQRLRDLHFKVSAPDTKVVDGAGNPQLVIHKTPNDFTVFDNSRSIGNLNWAATPKAFEGENGVYATGAGTNPKEMRLYVNMKNPHYPTIDEGMEPAFIEEGEDGILGIVDKDRTNYYKSALDAGEGFDMSLGVDNPYALKSANVVTYDNNGVRIPLGMRDNFKINDIRYGLLPFLGLGTASALYGTSDNKHSLGGNLFGDGSYMEQAKALIRNNEGWSSTPYKDAPKGASWRSVGYGFNDSGFREKYPEGISKHYEHGITRAQAEQELDYYLTRAEKQLRGIYGKRWDSFTDGQKAAILDTYYQRPASVANKSAFYNAVMSGKDPSKYLGVVGFDKRNNIRRNAFLGGFSGSYDVPQDAYAIQQYNNVPTTLFAPSNPEVFFGGYQAPEIEAPLPSVELDETPQYSEEEIARQERRERLNNLSMLMNLTSPQGSSNSILDAIGLLMR